MPSICVLRVDRDCVASSLETTLNMMNQKKSLTVPVVYRDILQNVTVCMIFLRPSYNVYDDAYLYILSIF